MSRKVNIRMNSTSTNKLAAALNQKFSNIMQVNAEALQVVADSILADSLSQVPRATNALASTGGTSEVKVNNTIISVKVGYCLDGKDSYNENTKAMVSQYMMAVHEDLGKQHPNGGKAKFLEDPLHAAENTMTTLIREATKSVL